MSETDNYIKIIMDMSYEKKLDLVKYLKIENKLYKSKIEVFNGTLETAQFCHFKDVDTGMDYSLRQIRNYKTIQNILKILGNDLTRLNKYINL